MTRARYVMERSHRPTQAPQRLATPALFRRYRKTSEREARDVLVRRFLPLAHRLARRFARTSEPDDDLRQVASVALIKAVERYDPGRGTSFAAFAVPTVVGELKRHFRDTTWSLHVPRRAQEQGLAIEQAMETLTNRHGRTPTVAEVAEHLHISTEAVLDGLLAANAYQTLSLDAPHKLHDDDEREDTLGETLGAEDDRYGLVEDDVTLAGVLRTLPERERLILRLRFVEDLTQTEIAARVGVSQMQVSRLLRESITRLRERTRT
jgi:RNA polymerase sigma-B factor